MTPATASATETLRILVADKLAEPGLDAMRAAGAQVELKPGLSEDELAAIAGEYDGMVVRSGAQVTAKVLQTPGRLRAIARAGVGVDNIDLDAATRVGVLVMNSAEASTITTAEHAFALLMALARNIGPAYRTMADGGWDRNKFVGAQLAGKTLGIVGFGRIGRTVAERALAFDMKVLAFDPLFNEASALDGRVNFVTRFDELLPNIDFLSFHVPLNDHTRHMLNAEAFATAKPGLRVVNAARGGVIDPDALLAALDAGQCAGAALDVYDVEPLEAESPLRRHPRVLCTPHLGASTAEAQEAVSTHACEQLIEYLRGEGIRGAVNAPGLRLDLTDFQRSFVDLAQRMGRLIAPMCAEGFREVAITLQGERPAAAASTIERVALVELLSSLFAEQVNVVNVRHVAEQRGIAVKLIVEDERRPVPMLRLDLACPSQRRYIVGRVDELGVPRVLEINGYHMDMVPAGPMVLMHNEDRPGMIGLVGTAFGDAGANIADMTITRRGETAIMILKLDVPPKADLLDRLRKEPGILKVAALELPAAAEPNRH